MNGGKVRSATLLVVAYLFFAEGLSWWTLLGPGPCLVGPEQHQQSGSNDNQKTCPTFLVGSTIFIGRVDRFIARHDKSIIAVFTIVLAISTIGLWLSSYEMARAGERELEAFKAVSNRQSVDMQASISAAKDAANAANRQAQYLRNAERPYLRPANIELVSWTENVRDMFSQPEFALSVNFDIANYGNGLAFIKGWALTHEICIEGRQGGVELRLREGLPGMFVTRGASWRSELPFFVTIFDSEQKITPLQSILQVGTINTLYFYGFLRYSDLFGVTRRTGFMFEFVPDRDHPGNGSFIVCPHPMWSDDEEEDAA